jgi:CheY-like chemotaxis protein
VALSSEPRWRDTVLIVEDNDDLREMFARCLTLAGFRVREAADGPEALRTIESYPPNLVLLDIGLPTLDGLSVRDEIRAHAETRDIPIVIVTGGADRHKHRLRNDCVLRKPVTFDRLIATVREWLKARTKG